MPSARPSAFRGASGILRDVDGVITGIRFTGKNPLEGKGTPKPGQKKSDFPSLFAVLDVRVDGAQASSPQPLFVGSAEDFGITEDEMGLTGDGQLSKSSGWWIFLDSLVNPSGQKGTGFDETNFPDDDPNVADYSAIVGARVRFNWQVNEKATKKYGKKVSKVIDPKTKKAKEYDREDLIVTAYYGQVEVKQTTPAVGAGKVGVSATQPAGSAKPLGGGKAPKGAKATDVVAIATKNILLAVTSSKDKKMTKSKVGVKLLTLLGDQTPELRSAVQDWAFDNANLAKIDGLSFDVDTETLSVAAEE